MVHSPFQIPFGKSKTERRISCFWGVFFIDITIYSWLQNVSSKPSYILIWCLNKRICKINTSCKHNLSQFFSFVSQLFLYNCSDGDELSRSEQCWIPVYTYYNDSHKFLCVDLSDDSWACKYYLFLYHSMDSGRNKDLNVSSCAVYVPIYCVE